LRRNRNFIEDCLERAIKEIRKDDSPRLDWVTDRDVRGMPGAVGIGTMTNGNQPRHRLSTIGHGERRDRANQHSALQ
jgi:hypothetical protein